MKSTKLKTKTAKKSKKTEQRQKKILFFFSDNLTLSKVLYKQTDKREKERIGWRTDNNRNETTFWLEIQLYLKANHAIACKRICGSPNFYKKKFSIFESNFNFNSPYVTLYYSVVLTTLHNTDNNKKRFFYNFSRYYLLS